MGQVIMGMRMSLDGFINDDKGSVSRLYPDMQAMHQSKLLEHAIKTTGAVIMGRHAYDMAQGDFTGYEFQTPIFVITHHAPETPAKGENENLKFHFVTDGVEGAMAQAKAAAGGKDVQVIGGANVIQQLIQAKLGDELQIDIMPILLGSGLRLFEHLGTQPIELASPTAAIEDGVVHLAFQWGGGAPDNNSP